jgi:glycerol-3-phosphate O-acyltransferase
MSGILDNPGFRAELDELARSSGRSVPELRAEAVSDLQEMRSVRNPLAVQAFAALGRFIYRRGYHREPVYDLDEVERVRVQSHRKSIVYLVTHKTYLDFFVLFDFLYRQGIPTPYIFGGLNMNFAGFGTLARRAGGIFIRRSFKDDSVYKSVLKRYIESLIEDGSGFMWAIEGTRSRTGKLLVPKLGLLNYVGGVSRAMGEAAISYVPVSVVYDQIPDVVDMAAQEAGEEKKPENLPWFMDYVRSLGGPFGYIHIRFGEAMSMHETPDAPELDSQRAEVDSGQIEIQKLAFEACYRINEITPATMTSLIIMVLLCRGPCDGNRIRMDVAALKRIIQQRASRVVPHRPSQHLGTDPAESIESLLATGVLEATGSGPSRILNIAPDRLSVAIYYSNMAVHHFVIAAFTELALVSCLGSTEAPGPESVWTECRRLRNLFKFEFFFSRNAVFMEQIRQELDALHPDWRSLLQQGDEAIRALLKQNKLLVAAGVLFPFVNAYRVLAEIIDRDAASRVLADAELIALCQASARDDSEQAAVRKSPGLSRALLANAIRVADNRGLRRADGAEGDRERNAFIEELDATARSLDILDDMAYSMTPTEPL